jgi:catechol 2,3-dioxygenase-like lactoylglutathione lyase family enzyme
VASPTVPFIECEQTHAGLAVSDLAAALEFYTKKLGFQQAFTWGEPPTFAEVNLGKVQMLIRRFRLDHRLILTGLVKTRLDSEKLAGVITPPTARSIGYPPTGRVARPPVTTVSCRPQTDSPPARLSCSRSS